MSEPNNTLKGLGDEVVEAARLLHNLTLGDTTVIVRAPTSEKRDAIAAAGKRLRDAIQAASLPAGGMVSMVWQTRFVGETEWSDCSKEFFDWVRRSPPGDGKLESRELYTAPPPAGGGVPAGWQLVPIEPTKEMLDAVVTSVDEAVHGKNAEVQYREDWAAMLIAAPQNPAASVALPDVDWLSNVIRRIDGKHSLGAGALAEGIVEAMRNPS